MAYEKFEGKYIPKFESDELKCRHIVSKAFTNYAPCSCYCEKIHCADCMLQSRNHCIEYFKQHREHLQNCIDRLMESLKQERGEETMENDFPKLKPGMAITFTDNNKLGFMVSETQLMYVYPNNSYSAIVDGWDRLGDQEGIDVLYSKVEAVYAISDTEYGDVKPRTGFTPYQLARMAEALSNDEDPSDLDAVKLLWCRQNHKEMTVEDIEKELGYKIKVVGEEK